MTEVFLRRLSRWQAEAQREAFADMYVESYRGAQGEEFHSRQGFLRRFAEHVQHPGFDMTIASDPALVGFAYGFPPDRGGEWWQGFVGGVPQDLEEHTASGQVFAVVELLVLPSHRRLGVAGRLQDMLLSRSDAAVAAVLVETPNPPALAAYREWGWEKTGEVRRRPDRSVLEAWSRSLAE
ncbi:GNAT family N-acetyltransferase [Streptomyces sp. H10-C2]|uniref:GNAT family N-acetyltransferase n=1 Tax=unclassified Streptomyces TaxID=2593676 RepID=UPI0024BBA792|nr:MULTISPECIES: GNAT family N-acetyltransferase [unclassified Streptomyces]MDJ0344012.1 GNAT family N-acetyltransferase [Streptomyces sp. PH10-H1]MDJ0373497.1 GNAT family N-acetyltransferase [Streptomyces sp. H10-C2]